MKKIIVILLLSLTSTAYALPDCPSDESVRRHNCFGGAILENGYKYDGEWKDGTAHGLGTLTTPDSAKYVGEWKDGERHGLGTLTTPGSGKYAGEWKDGEEHGLGTYTIDDNNKYAGEWKDGERHGLGTHTLLGIKRSGYFINGEFVPDVCENMGLSRGTSGFEQCVRQLIDKL